MVGVVLIAIKDHVYMIEGAWLDAQGAIPVAQEPLCELDDPERFGAEAAGLHLHMGGGQAQVGADLVQVLRFGFDAFAHDEEPSESLANGGSPPQVARSLSLLGLVVFSHARRRRA